MLDSVSILQYIISCHNIFGIIIPDLFKRRILPVFSHFAFIYGISNLNIRIIQITVSENEVTFKLSYSSDADHIYKRKEEDHQNRIFLFIRKNKDDNEAKEFYFLGEMTAEGEPEQIYMESTKDSAFEIHYMLETPVRSDIYDYIVRD